MCLYNFIPAKSAVWHVPVIRTTCGGYRWAILLFKEKFCTLGQISSKIHQGRSLVFQKCTCFGFIAKNKLVVQSSWWGNEALSTTSDGENLARLKMCLVPVWLVYPMLSSTHKYSHQLFFIHMTAWGMVLLPLHVLAYSTPAWVQVFSIHYLLFIMSSSLLGHRKSYSHTARD